jgi:F-type H+-transporting ATPase subunit O
VLAENKRLMFIKEISEKYAKLYQQFNKEEKITIISAYELSTSEQQEVLDALKQNPQNTDKDFIIDFKVDGNILGGL